METTNPPKEELSGPLSAETKQAILFELEKIVSSKLFSRSRRHKAILTFLVQRKLDGRDSEITEQAVAKRACARGNGFDPNVDSTVRAEVSRLRARLDGYYATEGSAAEIEICLPAGYIPRFLRRQAYQTEALITQPASVIQEDDVGVSLAELDAYIRLQTSTDAGEETSTTSTPLKSDRQYNDENAPSDRQQAAINETVAPRKRWIWVLAGALASVLVMIPLFAHRLLPTRQEPLLVTWYPGGENEPALSPDGENVAFVWNGGDNRNFDIYTKPLHGGDLVRLTSKPALDHSPAWSPDGKTIAFLRRLPGMRQAVYIVPANGGEEKKVAEIQTLVSGICWTPDSRHLIVPDRPKGVPLALFLLSTNTGERHQLTDYFTAFHPAVSPDGRTLAFLQEHKGPTVLYFLSLNKNFLPDGLPKPSQASMSLMRYLKWARDGRSLLFSVAHGQSWRAYRYWIESERIEPLSALGDAIRTIEDLPNKRGVLVTRGKEHRTIVRASLGHSQGGTGSEIVSVSDDGEPSVSPDGKLVALVSMRNSPTLRISNIDGSKPISVWLKDVEITSPRWSPDSKMIVFTGWKKNRPRIYGVSADSGQVEELRLDKAHNTYATYSRDGKWIYFISDISGSPRVWKAPAKGGAPVLVLSAPADYVEESIDGQSLLYCWNSEVYRLSLRDNTISRIIDEPDVSLFRPGKAGIYYETRDMENGLCRLKFQPFRGGPPVSIFAPREEILGYTAIPGFSVLPDESALLAEVRKLETNLEVFPE